MRRRWQARGLVAVIVVLAVGLLVRQNLVGADGYAILRPVTASELESRQEASLSYPGSTRIRKSVSDMTPNDFAESGSPAIVDGSFVVDAAPGDVSDWFSQRLRALGWSVLGPGLSAGAGTTLYSWTRGSREVIYIYIIGANSLDYIPTDRQTEYRYAYLVGLPQWWPYFPPF
jgi:hypothetical protein